MNFYDLKTAWALKNRHDSIRMFAKEIQFFLETWIFARVIKNVRLENCGTSSLIVVCSREILFSVEVNFKLLRVLVLLLFTFLLLESLLHIPVTIQDSSR